MLSIDGSLDYNGDLTRMPVRLQDDPMPQPDCDHEAFKVYVLKYTVRPKWDFICMTGTCAPFEPAMLAGVPLMGTYTYTQQEWEQEVEHPWPSP